MQHTDHEMIPAVGDGGRRVWRGAGDCWTAVGRSDIMFFDKKAENIENFVQRVVSGYTDCFQDG